MNKLSKGISLIWVISANMASKLGYKEIEPEHFLLGILKLLVYCDHLPDQMPKLSKEDMHTIKEELIPTKNIFVNLHIDIGILRTNLLALLAIGDNSGINNGMHRSAKSRKLFDQLINSNNSSEDEIKTVHLLLAILELPSVKISSLLKDYGIDKDELTDKIRELSNSAKEENKDTPFLNEFGRNITKLAKLGKLNMVIARDNEIRALGRILLQKNKSNAILIGEAGVGKTAVVEGLAQKIVDGEIPEQLKGKSIIEISIAAIVAGTKYRGEFEERMQKILDEAVNNEHIILFIDEIHTLIGAGASSGALDAANILKPALARGELQFIGATTTNEYRKFIEKDNALERRLQVVKIEEPDIESCIKILSGIKINLENHYGVKISDLAIKKAVELTVKYLPNLRLPDKAIDIIDSACSVKLFPSVYLSADPKADSTVQQIDIQDITKAVSAKCGIPLAHLTQNETDKFLKIEEFLKERVISQDEAIKEVSETITTAKSGLKAPNKPIGVFLFVGPTGTGKTELAKAIAEFLFNDQRKLIRFDMSEYMEKHQISRLIGAPPGYIGHEEEGLLISKVRTNPYSVILFDEIEKAHPDINNLFLQIFDEGTLTGSQGKIADFKESIIILTSNIGSKAQIQNPKANLGFKKKNDTDEIRNEEITYKQHILKQVKSHFSPELFNRIQKTVVFYHLQKSEIGKILDKIIKEIELRLKEKEITIIIDDDAKEYLIEKGYSRELGVRNLQRTVEKEIIAPLGKLILQQQIVNKQINITKPDQVLGLDFKVY